MKKVYSLLTLLMLAILSFNTSASKTVTIYCSFVDAIEVRDGSADGTKLPVEANPATVTFESDALYIGLTDDSKLLSGVVYTCPQGYMQQATITGNSCIIPLADMHPDDVKINIDIVTPKIVKLNVPDPTLITAKTYSNDTNSFDLVEGVNDIKLGQYTNLYVEVKDPANWKLTKFYRVSDNREYTITQYRSCEVNGYEINAGDEFSYTLVPASEFKAPTFTLTVDHPELAEGITVDYNTIKGLEANVPYKYEMSSLTASLQINPKYGVDIYQVTQNGDVVPPYYDSYNFTVNADDNIVVTFDFPEVYSNVTITSEPAENIDFVSGVKIGGVSVENWKETFPGQVGKTMELTFNTDYYKYVGITVNDAPLSDYYGYGPAKVKVTAEDMNIVVTSEKYPVSTATLHVDLPESIELQPNLISTPLVAGENTIEFTEVSSYLNIMAKSGYMLNKVSTVIGEDVTEQPVYSGRCSISLVEGMIIFVESHAIVKDQHAVIYSTHSSKDELFERFQFMNRFDYTEYDLEAGYNHFDFAQIFNPFALSAMDETHNAIEPSSVYINGEKQAYYYGWEFSLNDGDVVKMFFGIDPATYTATFNVADGCEIEVVKDLIVPVEDLTAGVTDFEGTAIQLKNANAEKSIEVYVAAAEAPAAEGDDTPAGDKLEADENGYYNVTLDGSKTITVSLAKQDGVESVNAAAVAESRDVYTLTGILLISNATDAQLKALPAGIYVVGGRKLVIR